MSESVIISSESSESSESTESTESTGESVRGHRITRANYYGFLQNLDFPVMILDSRDQVLFCNQSASEMVGYPASELVGTNFFETMRLPPESAAFLDESPLIEWERNAVRTFHTTGTGMRGIRFLAWKSRPIMTVSGERLRQITAIDETSLRQLLREEKRFFLAMEAISDGVLIVDIEGIIEHANPAFQQITGIDITQIQGKKIDELGLSEQGEGPSDRIKVMGNHREHWSGEWVGRNANGELYHCEGSITCVHLSDDSISYLVIIRDVTAKKESERKIAELLGYLESLVEHAPVGVWIVNFHPLHSDSPDSEEDRARFWHESISASITSRRVNSKLAEILQRSREDLMGRSIFDPDLLEEKQALNLVREIRSLRDGEPVSFEAALIRNDGKQIPVLMEAVPVIRDEDTGKSLEAMLMVMDVSDRKWIEEQLQNSELELKWTLKKLFQANQSLEDNFKKLETLSTTDELTQIPNRRRFREFLAHEWRRAVRKQTSISLILLDIDYFKYYNDTYGHQGGDQCLKSVALAMNERIKRTTDIFARYGGEEFVAVLPETPIKGAMRVAEDLRLTVEKLKLENVKSDLGGIVTMSIGVAHLIPENAMEEQYIIEMADRALYEAKARGRNRVYALRYTGDQECPAIL